MTKKYTNTRACLSLALLMEAFYKSPPDVISYDDLHTFIANQKIGRFFEISIEMDDSLPEAEEKVYTQIISCSTFRRDTLDFMAHLESRYYENEEERIILPSTHLAYFRRDHPDNTLTAEDVTTLYRIFRFPNGRLDKQYEDFLRLYYAVHSKYHMIENIMDVLADSTELAYRSLPFLIDQTQLSHLLNSQEWCFHEDVLGKILAWIPVEASFIRSIADRLAFATHNHELFRWLPLVIGSPNESVIGREWSKCFTDNFKTGSYLFLYGAYRIAKWKMTGPSLPEVIESLFDSDKDTEVALGMASLTILLDKYGPGLKADTERLGKVVSRVMEILSADCKAHCAAAQLALELVYHSLLLPSNFDIDAIYVQTIKRLSLCKAEEELLALFPIRDRSHLVGHDVRNNLASHYSKIMKKMLHQEWYSNYPAIAFSILSSLGIWEPKTQQAAFEGILKYASQNKDDLDYVDLHLLQQLLDQVFAVKPKKTHVLLENVSPKRAEELKQIAHSGKPLLIQTEAEALEIIFALMFFGERILEAEGASTLLQATTLPDAHHLDPLLILLWFTLLCRYGNSTAVSFYNHHEAVLLRPLSLFISEESDEDEDLECEMTRAWSCIRPYLNRVTFGIRAAIAHGHVQLADSLISNLGSQFLNTDVRLTAEEALLCMRIERGLWYGIGSANMAYDSGYDICFDRPWI